MDDDEKRTQVDGHTHAMAFSNEYRLEALTPLPLRKEAREAVEAIESIKTKPDIHEPLIDRPTL